MVDNSDRRLKRNMTTLLSGYVQHSSDKALAFKSKPLNSKHDHTFSNELNLTPKADSEVT